MINVLTGLFLIIFSTTIFGEIPKGHESYSIRPDILNTKSKAHKNLGAYWEKLKAAHMDIVAMLFEVYPTDQHFYFLARDGELLYDIARLAAKDDPELLARIHLLNVSRDNMKDNHIRDYLKQEGISEELLEKGKKILLVDTGFKGTIPNAISSLFSSQARAQIQGHLICSTNSDFPSSRVFLKHLNPAINTVAPQSMHQTIYSYEKMAHYTDRSTAFVFDNGTWNPVSPQNEFLDGKVSRQIAAAFQEDLKNYFLKNKKHFHKKRKFWKRLNSLPRDELILMLKELMLKNPEDPFYEAVARDYIEMNEKNVISNSHKITLSDLGLKENIVVDNRESNKSELITKFPKWKKYLENPEVEIVQLIKEEKWEVLSPLFDLLNDQQISQILAKELGKKPLSRNGLDFIKSFIEKGNQEMMIHLASFAFSEPHAVSMKEIIKLLIEKGDNRVWKTLAIYVFSKPYSTELKDLLRLLVEKNDQITLIDLAKHAFPHPHMLKMNDLLSYIINTSDNDVLLYFASQVFSGPLVTKRKEQIRLIIKKGDQSVLQTLIREIFIRPETALMEDLLMDIIKKADQTTLKWLATNVYTKPHTVLMKKSFKLLIENADENVLKIIKENILSLPHTQTTEYELFKEAIKIDKRSARQSFLKTIKRESSVPFSKITPDLQVGNRVKTKKGIELTVVKFVGEGEHGRVFLVLENDGSLCSIKVAKNQNPTTIKFFSKETIKNKNYEKINISFAKIKDFSSDYVVKEWVEGLSAHQLLSKFEFMSEVQIKKLIELVEKLSQKGVYIEGLEVKNVIWSNGQWVIVDSGDIKAGLTISEALKWYQEQIPLKWAKGNGPDCPSNHNVFEIIDSALKKLDGLISI